MHEFLNKFKKLRKEKNSLLCIGLDPSPDEKDPLEFCLKIIESTAESAVAFKPNTQFLLFTLDFRELKKLATAITDSGCLSILDHKLSDIGSSNDAALTWASNAGFDAITISPFPGNIKESIESAHKKDLAVFVLTLMSNPEAQWIQKDSKYLGKPLYQKIALEAQKNKADGVVVGTTGHVSSDDIKQVRKIIGDDSVFLCPGVGAQGGDLKKILDNAGGNVLINVGRSIIHSKSPRKDAQEYRDLIKKQSRL